MEQECPVTNCSQNNPKVFMASKFEGESHFAYHSGAPLTLITFPTALVVSF